MAKVTEQDLIDRGFKRKWFDDKSGYWFEMRIKHKILKNINIEVITDRPRVLFLHIIDDTFRKPLTHENLDIFIKFAEGKEI